MVKDRDAGACYTLNSKTRVREPSTKVAWNDAKERVERVALPMPPGHLLGALFPATGI